MRRRWPLVGLVLVLVERVAVAVGQEVVRQQELAVVGRLPRAFARWALVVVEVVVVMGWFRPPVVVECRYCLPTGSLLVELLAAEEAAVVALEALVDRARCLPNCPCYP
jgi:hypothetical protein